MKKFEELGLSQALMATIARQGIHTPTLIQEKSIPLIMDGKDVIGESATGSGKTLAFGAGILETVIPGKGLQALVLTPTRELAEQVKVSINRLAGKKKLTIIPVYGGVSINPQIDGLRKAEVAVATPGRLLDHLMRGTVNLSRINILVLDEADRMLDMGFIEDIEKIIRACPKKRQTMFFSATILPRIASLAHKYMNHPQKILASKQVDPSKLKQVYYDVQRNIKLSLLAHLLSNEDSELVMVFCNTRRTVDFVVKNLKSNKVKAIAIHGGLTQSKRTNTMETFNKGKVNVLVCTDVAARGLHIESVSHIYNYEIPKDPTDYVHRIGRTARAGEKGKVINLLCDVDHENFGRIQGEYRDFVINRIEKPKVERLISIRDEGRSRGRFGGGQRGGPRGGARGGSRGGPRGGPRGGRPQGNRGQGSGPRRGPSSPHRRTAQQRRAGSGSKGRSGPRSGSGSGSSSGRRPSPQKRWNRSR